MNNKDKNLDLMLKSYCTRKSETFSFSKPKKFRYPALVAACLVLVMLAGVFFIPSPVTHKEHSFIIVANAQTLDEAGIASADEITNEAYVELKNLCGNTIYYDFNNKLSTDAREIDFVKTYLFQSFATILRVNVVGEDIESITYKPSQGAISVQYTEHPESTELNSPVVSFSYNRSKPEYTINYDKQQKAQIIFNPVYDENAEYELVTKYFSYKNSEDNVGHGYMRTDELVFSEDSDALHDQYGWVSGVGSGYRTNAASVVTAEEIETLKSYIKADDMVGFFNFQNQIFKRLVEDITIDVTVTFTSGETVTKTLELTYTPIEITEADDYLQNQYNTYSDGYISAKLK